MAMIIEVDCNNEFFVVKCPMWDNERIKKAPERKFDNKLKLWKVPITRASALFFKRNYSGAEITKKAKSRIKKAKDVVVTTGGFPTWYKFKNPPMSHQRDALNHAWGKETVALFMEMRTGKTFVAICWATALAMQGEANGMIVIVPNSIILVWKEQLQEHSPIPINCHAITAGDKRKTQKFIEDNKIAGFKVLLVGIESLSHGNAVQYAEMFCANHKTVCVVDESSRIKNNKSLRTERTIDIGGLCKYRMILTGTPITQGIEDLFSQFRFLDWKILGFKSEFTFRNHYCIMGGFEGRKIVGYRNVGELIESTKPFVYQCTADEVLDLPEKIYEQRTVVLSSEQNKILKDLGDPFNMRAEFEDESLAVEHILERMTRYQQIVGGLFPFDQEDGTTGIKFLSQNPKLKLLMETIEDLPKDKKIIIWARFRPEIKIIVESLKEKYGQDSVAEFHGGVESLDEKENNIRMFRENDGCRFFVSNQQSGGMGLELSASSVHMFYSNSFSYEERSQAEARTNSKHQKANSILYVDFCADHKIDKSIMKAILTKKSMADFVRMEMSK